MDNPSSSSDNDRRQESSDGLSRKPWETIRPGDVVTHKSLGPGIIVALDEDYLIVKFTDRESKFRYPSAFEKGYLDV